ncbi:MAG: protein kinase, partial [Planctomycetaceae bacterium]|nr:protein kinase [Planctomycetaceae bacterium]
MIQRFKLEAQNAAKLNHPHICTIFDFGHSDDVTYITMEYIEGKPLEHWVGKSQKSVAGAVRMVHKIAQGLAHAHDKGVVHRDMKPDNVMVDGEGNPHIMDFGLAFQSDTQSRRTSDGIIMGTPAYMSPEQIHAVTKNVGPLVDVYALGVILYEMLTGQLPFQGNVATTLTKILTETPEDPRTLRPDLEPDLSAYCLKLMGRDPKDRPQAMTEVVKMLAQFRKRATKQSTRDVSLSGDLPTATITSSVPSNFSRLSGLNRSSDKKRNRKRNKPEYSKATWLGSLGGILLCLGIVITIKIDGCGNENENVATPTKPAPTPRNSDPAKTAKAFRFDGTDWVELQGLRHSDKEPWTLEAIVCPKVLNRSLSIISNMHGYGLGLTMSEKRWGFSIHGGKQTDCKCPSVEAPRLNEVVHLAGVYDGHFISLFVNGRLQYSPIRVTDYKPSPQNFLIGADPDSDGKPQHCFEGDIYGVRISNSVRYATDFTPPRELIPDTQAIAVYNAHEGLEKSQMRNLVADRWHGKCHGVESHAVPEWKPPPDQPVPPKPIPSAFHFHGNDWIELGDLKYSKVEPWTVEAIVRTQDTFEYQSIVSNADSSGLGLLLEYGRWQFVYRQREESRALRSTEPSRLNEVAHLAGVFDGQSLSFYVNGQLQQSPLKVGSHLVSPWNFFIGADPDQLGKPQNFFEGDIYGVRISNTARYSADFLPPKELISD